MILAVTMAEVAILVKEGLLARGIAVKDGTCEARYASTNEVQIDRLEFELDIEKLGK
jgi:hypothetical protein